MKKLLLFIIPLLVLAACGNQKKYVVGETAFCKGLEETSLEKVYCVDSLDVPINGKVVEYYSNGKKLREMTIRGGYENGIEREYYETGKLRVETNVIDGKADGLSKLYDENGKLYMEMTWVNGDATNIKVYDKSGKVIASDK